MSCRLDKFTVYDVSRVVHDSETGRVVTQLTRPPKDCPDGTFSGKATVRVQAGMGPFQTYDATLNAVTVVVPSKDRVEEVQHSPSFFGAFFVGVLICAAIYGLVRLVNKVVSEEQKDGPGGIEPDVETKASRPTWVGVDEARTKPTPPDDEATKAAKFLAMRKAAEAKKEHEERMSRVSPLKATDVTHESPPKMSMGAHVTAVSVPPSSATVVNNNSSNDGLLAGVLIGSMLGGHSDHERIIERETIREVPVPAPDNSFKDSYVSHDSAPTSPSYESKSDDSSYESSSSDNSYSSDSSSDSSYSSDSSSSYDSDSSDSSYGGDS